MSNENIIDVFENDMALNLQLFCEENNIEDLRSMSQAVWNSALYYIYKRVFKGTNKLRSNKRYANETNTILTNYNAYDYELLFEILEYYIHDMCLKYDKEVSIVGFSILTGIDRAVIYEWGQNNKKLSTRSFDIFKTLHDMREESLSDKLVSQRGNPVGLLGVLNRHYGWNMGQPRDAGASQRALSAAELPQLGNAQPVELIEVVQESGKN